MIGAETEAQFSPNFSIPRTRSLQIESNPTLANSSYLATTAFIFLLLFFLKKKTARCAFITSIEPNQQKQQTHTRW